MNDRKLPQIQNWLKTQVSPDRFKHIQGVAKTAKRLVGRYRLSPEKAELAGWLHDCAKELSRSEMRSWIRKGGFRLDPAEQTMPGLWHPHAGAAIAKVEWGIKDTDVLEAIRCHTLGSARMGRLAQLLFVSDFVEPGRRFPGVERARRVASRNLEEGVMLKASMTMSFLFEKKMKIHSRLLETWNSFLKSHKMPG